ncbi:MAG: YbhB/YbcL family Raf kinase inhibitor-like protein [Mizugakiibacter sp.]|uniref:YbhB/YbcL family Raf kinase inhibitor-like protein n=1 Tax=Mizugakiibacter sp. TaxID=1972610 RepID=UPI0031C76776|nr:YbhB/YbcL family Raf kinase inhibitor-like protein [Xanthomonadaceae bacterium]
MPRTLAAFLAFAFAGSAHAGEFRLHVDAADAHGRIAERHAYDGYGCRGDNLAPRLDWQGAPAGTRSFAVTVYDPDAPTGHGWWHWFVIDLPASAHALPEGGALPKGARALRNDFGAAGWGGPCPPAGDPPHRYVFAVHALDVAALPVRADASPATAAPALRDHTLGKAEVTLTYGR